MPLEAEVADLFSDLHTLKSTDDLVTEDQSDDKSQSEGEAGSECDEIYEVTPRHIPTVEGVYQPIKHRSKRVEIGE